MKNAITTKLETALHLLQQNNISDAKELLLEILALAPNNSDALHAMGLLYVQKENFTKALPLLEKAVSVSPSIAEFHNNLANAYKALGKVELAKQHYFEALKLKAHYPQAHNNLGTLLYKLGNFDEAITHFQKALRMAPLAVDTHYNLANCYVKVERMLDATAHYEEVLKRRPEHLGALHNLGITFCFLKRFEKAEPLLEKVSTREPDNIDALFHLGVIASALAEAPQAKQYYERVLALNPAHANTHRNLATVYLHLFESDKALYHFQEALKQQKENQTVHHMIDALTGKTHPAGAPIEYTRALFDQYAYSYDQQVKINLKYQVPSLLREQVSPYITQEPDKPWNILDLGCGTGLCAPYFSDIAGKVIGVDVSPNMIEVAKQLGAYATLHVIDAISFLKTSKLNYELIISADVFVYFGDLKEVFTLIHQSLKTRGLSCFSIESLNEESDTGRNTELNEDLGDSSVSTHYRLRKSGRYAHHAKYIEKLASQIGLTIKSETSRVIRLQENLPVQGKIYVMVKN